MTVCLKIRCCYDGGGLTPICTDYGVSDGPEVRFTSSATYYMRALKACYSTRFLLQDALEFAHAHGIVPRMTIFEGVEKAPDAYKAMRDGEYKVVIRMACE